MDGKRTGAVKLLRDAAQRVAEALDAGEAPSLSFPLRSLKNVSYDPEKGYLEIGPRTKKRSLSVATVKSFAQTLRMMALSKEMIEADDFATKREAYYVSKNWGDCRFDEQRESDALMDDVEALASRYGLMREDLRFYPEEHGGSVAGNLVVVDRDPETGASVEIDCSAFGTGAYTIPRSVEHLEFRTEARFAIAIETGGMYQRLVGHKFWRRADCVLVELGGVPSRATRRFLRRLAESAGLEVYCFVDCDPYGIANIYRTLKAGSGNAAHINQFFSVPGARFLGVTPQDIVDFGLEDATHPLGKNDIKRAEDALSGDPFFAAHPQWQAALRQMLEMGVRAEQQALAKWGLNYVIDEYLPKKLAEPERFLP